MIGIATELLLLLGRGALLLAAAFVVSRAFRRSPAALRHHVWTLSFVGLLALPLLALSGLSWELRLPVYVSGGAAIEPAATVSPTLEPLDPPVEMASRGDAPVETDGTPVARNALEPAEAAAAAESGLAARVAELAELPASAWLIGLWALGALWLLGRLAVGTWRASRLVRRAVPVTDRQWTSLVALLSLRSGLTDEVRVVRSAEAPVPMAWGLFGSWLVLPARSSEWSEERRRVVVLHELAHLRRRDCVKQFFAEFALALHWPNPLAWKAMARMRAERERASDDAVLSAGTRGSEYAGHLVEVARGLTGRPAPVRTAIAMARRSELEGRVLAILDDGRPRALPSRRLYVAATLGVVCFVLPLAAFTPALSQPPGDERETGRITEQSHDSRTPPANDDPDLESVETALAGAGSDRNEQAARQSPVRSLEHPLNPAATDGAVAADTIEEKVVRVLAGKLKTGDVAMRRRAAQTLGMMEHPAAVPALMAAVTADEDETVRARAAWALGMIESPEAVEALASATGDESGDVRQKALWALGMIESPAGVSATVAFLRDSDPEIRETAVWALGMIESSEAVAPLVDAMRGEDSASVREQIAWALGMIESAQAVVPLMEAYETEPDAEVREQIVWALGMIESREAAPTLIDALEDPDQDVSDQALWALGMVLD